MSTTMHRDVVEHSVEAFVAEVVALTLDGWAVDPSNPGAALGFASAFAVTMYRDEDTVEQLRLKGVNIAEKPKLTRAETLALARAAKKARATLDTDTIQ